MTTRTAALRLQLIDLVSGPAKGSAGALGRLESSIAGLGKKGAPGAKRLVDQLQGLQKKAAAIGEFRELRRGLKSAGTEMMSARSNVQRLEQALRNVTKPTGKMTSDFRTAQSVLKSTTSAFRAQGGAVRAAEQALRAFGVNGRSAISGSQRQIRGELAQTITKMRAMRAEARKPLPKAVAQARSRVTGASSPAYEAGVAIGGAAVARGGKRVAERSLNLAVDFNRAWQRRDAVGGFSGEESASLNQQAERLGQATEFENVDIVQGQTKILQAGIRNAGQIETLTDSVVNYSRAVGVTMEQGAESITALALTKGVDLNNETAVKNLVDRQVWMSKNSGMDDEDLRQFSKYGGAASKAVGLPDDYFSAAGMTLKRAGIRGDESGVAMRAASAKLTAPTRKGRMALQTMGLNFDDYVTQPDAFSLPGFEAGLKENFGIRLTKEMREALLEAWDGEFSDSESGEALPVKSDRGEFTSRTMDAIDLVLGEMSATDRKKIAAQIGTFHQMSAGSVDTKRLFDDVLRADPSMIQANGLFTEKQGSRMSILAQNKDNFYRAVDTMQNTPDGIAKKIGDDAMSGLYGDFERMLGSVNNAVMRISQDWEGPIRRVITGIDSVADGFSGLSENTRRLVEVLGFAVTGIAGIAAWRAGTGLLGRALGTGGAGALGAGGGATSGVGTKFVKTVKVLGPLGIVAGAGLDVYDAANDPNATDAQKSAKYTGAAVGAGGALAGAKAGAALGAWGGPWGAAIGGAAGGVGGYLAGDALGEYLGGKMFQQDPTRAAGDQLAQETLKWHVAAQQGMREYINALATGGTEAEAKAAAIAAEIQSILSVEGNPTVNTASLERALALARQVAAVVGGNPSIATAPAGDASMKIDGARARGGPVRKGGVYRVNEEGEELFVPGTDGTIIPHGASMSSGNQRAAGGSQVSVTNHNSFNITVTGGGDEKAADRLARIIEGKLSRSAQTMFGGLKFGDA